MSALHIEVRGDGPTLALLHGWGLNLRVWDGLAGVLSRQLRIVAVDLPGHGRSDWLPERSALAGQAEQVHEAVSAIAGTYSLLGWSLGGQIALQLAARPEMAAAIDRLVLIAATPRLSSAADWPHGTAPQRLAEQESALRTDYHRTVGDFLELQVRGSAGGEAALAQLRAALFAHGEARPQALARGLQLLRDGDLRPLLGAIAQPALVIAGQYDRVTLPAASRALAEGLPHARFVEIRRAAHAPFLSHLDEVSILVREFVGCASA
jgi:pimeloyl-[acyl-carrier protein] methyl ester esterase